MAHSRISIPRFFFVFLACIYFVTIVAQPTQSDENLEDLEEVEQYVPPKQSVYEAIYKKDQDHQKKSVYERLYKSPKPQNQPGKPTTNHFGTDFVPGSTDHHLTDDPHAEPTHFSTYLLIIFVSLFVISVIVALVLITMKRKFPKAIVPNKPTNSNEKPITNPSPTKNSSKKKSKSMLRRLQEISKQEAQRIVQNDVQELIRTDSVHLNSSSDSTESLEKKEINNNANDSDVDLFEVKENMEDKYNTVSVMENKKKRKEVPNFRKKISEASKQKEKPEEQQTKPEDIKPVETTAIVVKQPNPSPSNPVGTDSQPEKPDSVEPEDSRKDTASTQPLSNNNNKGSLSSDGIPPPSPRGERDLKFLYNIISSINTEVLTEDQKIAYAGVLLQKYAIDCEADKLQAKQQQFAEKEHNKQKRHEDEIQLKLAAADEIFQSNLFFISTLLLLGTWLFCLTQRYHGLIFLILNYWWDVGKYFIDSLGISVSNTAQSNWTWVNPFTLFEDMVLRTVNLLFALVSGIFLAVLTLRSPRVGLCVTAYIVLHVCWKSMLRIVVASTPLYLMIYLCSSLLPITFPKISYSRSMYKGIIAVSTVVTSICIGYQLVLCDPLNPELVPSRICSLLDYAL